MHGQLNNLHCKNEIERCVVPVYELDVVSPFRNGSFQVIAKGVWSLTHLLVDSSNNGLLDRFTFDG